MDKNQEQAQSGFRFEGNAMRISIFTAAICIAGVPARAQVAEPQALARDLGTPSLSAPVSPLGGAEVRATQDGTNATLKVGGTVSTSDREGVAIFNNWSVTATAPISKGTLNTDIATLDGLASASAIEFKFMQTLSPGRIIPSADATDAFCKKLVDSYIKQGGTQMAANALNCDTGTIANVLGADAARQFNDLFWKPDRIRYVWGVSAKVGDQNFKYFDATSLAAKSSDQTPWSIGGFLAISPVQWQTLFTLSFAYQEAYKDQKSLTLCPSSSLTPIVTCASGPIGSPSRSQKDLVSFEVRKAFSNIGVSAISTYDAKQGVFGIQVPVYIFLNGTGGLTGGIDFGWRDDTHKATVGAFVGQAFSLFN